MKRSFYRILSILLAVCLITALLPLTASAEGAVCSIGISLYNSLGDALAAVQNEDTIKLLQSIDYASGIVINGKHFTFDLNGFTLNVVNTSGDGLRVENGGVDLTGSGEFNVIGKDIGVWVKTGGTATVTNATATSESGFGVYAWGDGSITVEGDAVGPWIGAYAYHGGSIVVEGDASSGDTGVCACEPGSSVIVRGNVTSTGDFGAYVEDSGSITVEGNVTATGINGSGAFSDGGSITVNGSVYTNGDGAHAENSGDITIDGGIAAENYYITVGSDHKGIDDNEDFTTKEGYRTYTDGANTVWVKESAQGGNVCEIGATGYATLSDALAAAQDGDTIKLLDHISHNTGILIADGRHITFDLNGFGLTVTNNAGIGLEVTNGHVDLSDSPGAFYVSGTTHGVRVEGSNASATVTGAQGTAYGSYGAYARGGGSIIIQGEGNATGGAYGVYANGIESFVLVFGSVEGTAPGSLGATARNGGSITIHGNATGGDYGVYADGISSTVHVGGSVQGGLYGTYALWSTIEIDGDAAATGTGGIGARSDRGMVTVHGSVSGNEYGGMAGGAEGKLTIDGDATATGINGVGICASYGTAEVGGNVSAAQGIGAFAFSYGKITIDGVITADQYVKVENIVKTQTEFEAETTKAGYRTYKDSASIVDSNVWVKDTTPPQPDNVCEIGGTEYATLDAALAAVQDGQTIRLLADINYGSGISFLGQDVTFDLNGYKLNVVNNNGPGLQVESGIVDIQDSSTAGNGEFNVAGSNYGVVVPNNGSATVTNVTAAGVSGASAGGNGAIVVTGDIYATAYGVHANGSGSSVMVSGDVEASLGAWANTGGKITIDGEIRATTYIKTGENEKDIDEYVTPTTKPGYRTYTDGESTVWVKAAAGDTTPPAVSSVSPSGSNVSTSTSALAITFNEPMDISSPGSVTINNGAGLSASGTWSDSNKTIAYTVTDLVYGTTYSIGISDFKDVAGNTMITDNTHEFTTMDNPETYPPEINFGFADNHTFSASPSSLTMTVTEAVYKKDDGTALTNGNVGSLGLIEITKDGAAFTGYTLAYEEQTRTIFVIPTGGIPNGSYTVKVKNGIVRDNDGNDLAEHRRSFTVAVTGNGKPSGDHSSDRSGRSSASTPAPEPKPAAQVLDSNGNVIESITPRLDNSTGTAVVEVNSASLTSAFDKSKANDKGIKTVKVNIPKIDGTKAYETKLPSSFLTAGDVSKAIEIKTNIATVTVPCNMLTAAGAAGAQNVSLTIAAGDKRKLDAAVQAQIGGRPVIELNLKIDGKQISWSNESAPVTVAIPYKPTAEELKDPEHITVWYIDGTGKAVSVPNGRYDSATGMVIFTATHFSSYAVVYVAKAFDDLGSADWAKKQIEMLASKGILRGTTENKYSPQTDITRADFLYFMVRALGADTKVDGNFDDISSDAYYYKEIGIAKKLGIATGTGNNKFSPDASITRQDMMVLTGRALRILKKLKVQGTASDLEKFADKSLIAPYAIDCAASLVKEGLIVNSGGKVNPTSNTTRAEAAVLLYRIYNKY